MDLVDILLKSVDDCDNEKVEEILKKSGIQDQYSSGY